MRPAGEPTTTAFLCASGRERLRSQGLSGVATPAAYSLGARNFFRSWEKGVIISAPRRTAQGERRLPRGHCSGYHGDRVMGSQGARPGLCQTSELKRQSASIQPAKTIHPGVEVPEEASGGSVSTGAELRPLRLLPLKGSGSSQLTKRQAESV